MRDKVHNLSDWLIAGSLTLAVGTTASFVVPGGGAAGALLGSTTGAILGAAISSKRQDDKQQNTINQLKVLQDQVAKQEEWQKLNAQLTTLKVQVAELRNEQSELAKVQGKFTQKQAELQQVEQRLATFTQQAEELERRVAIIHRQQPNLSTLEQLQVQIEQFKLNKSGLEGHIKALHSQVESLEAQKRSLVNVEAEFATKKAQLDSLNHQIQQLQTKSQQLEQRTVELELLRATYDGLFSEKQSFEKRVNQLKPEIDRLEAEKQRILQAIQQNQQEYQQIEELRQRLRSVQFEIADKEAQLRELERAIQHLNSIKAGLEENNARLKQEQEKLQDEIRRLNGEIENLQNSATVALGSLKEPLWEKLPSQTWSVNSPYLGEQYFLEGFVRYIQSQGLTFPKRVIHAFHTSLKVQDISALVILAGISGTGKSELPQRYADYIGAQLLTLAVQPRWDSPQDLQGFYNYVERKFKPTALMRGLYQYKHQLANEDRLVIVVLDEMNLARVEYYFSDFLSKLETRRSCSTYLEIDVGSLQLKEEERRLKIPQQFLFVGTMNEDETTQSLSDKVLDRANVLTFGKPQELQLRQQSQTQNFNGRPSGYLTYSNFQNWTKKPESNSEVVKEVRQYLVRANQVMEKMGHPFAHRVYQAIIQYIVNYPMVDSGNFKLALADQFGQKLLPKLRGVMIDEFHEELEELQQIITEIGDNSLTEAYIKARQGRYGQFHWQGLVYQDEPVT